MLRLDFLIFFLINISPSAETPGKVITAGRYICFMWHFHLAKMAVCWSHLQHVSDKNPLHTNLVAFLVVFY